jgi:2-oxo-4-hydroxy-4-carboxy-5-ureidoimidazoline decarboxylase
MRWTTTHALRILDRMTDCPNAAEPQVPTHAGPASPHWTLDALQALSTEAFEAALGEAVEHAPWVARRAALARPFADVAALVQAMARTVHAASPDEQIALLRGHPELAGSEAREGRMTADSTSEQGRLGLDRLDRATLARLDDLNRRYRERFGFPLIIALRLHADLDSVLRQADERLASAPADERHRALQQVCEVMRGRLRRLVADRPSLPQPST